jgi:polysaccharide pyruvyl transferase WcaK-like protein
VFFDFSPGDVLDILVNTGIKLIGFKNYIALHRIYKLIKGNNYNQCKARAGIGIGVGTYTRSSRRFKHDILSLAAFDFLMVRDPASVNNSHNFLDPQKVWRSTDLAFSFDYTQTNRRTPNEGPTIGFILRDWPTGDHVTMVIEVARILAKRGTGIAFYSFDEGADRQFISTVSTFADIHIWNPHHISIDQFMAALADCQLIVSSRAHGAIIAACLGIPSLCVGIEPKLNEVANMLPQSSTILSISSTPQQAVELIESRLDKLDALKEAVVLDVRKNRADLNNGIIHFKEEISRIMKTI